jgi:alanine racemase
VRAWAEVDSAAIRSNVERLIAHAGRDLIAVGKANGYGLGATLVARAALEGGARALGVATVEEGEELRASLGPGPTVLVLGSLLDEERLVAIALGLESVVHEPEDLDRLGRAARYAERRARVHVKVDCGLARHGVEPRHAPELVERALSTPGVELVGLMTHLPQASSREETLEHLARFSRVVEQARARAPGIVVHAAASTAALLHEEARFDAIRPGIALQGVEPDGGVFARAGVRLERALSLRAKVVRVRELEPETDVGYGATFRTRRKTRLAVVALGYDDGLPYRLSNQGALLIHETRCPIVGTVMMDYVLADATDAPPVAPGDTATAIGRDGALEITVEEVARAASVIPYAVTCGLGRRATRIDSSARASVAEPLLTASARERRRRLG